MDAKSRKDEGTAGFWQRRCVVVGLLVGMMVVGAGLRLAFWYRFPFIWTDGPGYCYNAVSMVIGGQMHMGHTPGYSLPIAGFWLITGSLQASAKITSLLSSLLLIPVMFFLGRKLFSTKTGLLAAGLTVAWGTSLAASPAERPDALFMLLYTLSILVLLVAFEKRDWKLFALLGVTSAFAFLTRPAGASLPCAGLVFLLFLRSPGGDYSNRIRFVHGLVLVGLFLILNTPYWVYVRRQTGGWHLTGKAKSLSRLGYTSPETRFRKGQDASRAFGKTRAGKSTSAESGGDTEKNGLENTDSAENRRVSRPEDRGLRERLGTYAGNVNSLVWFSLPHLVPLHLLALFPLGLVLGLSRRGLRHRHLIAFGMIIPPLAILPAVHFFTRYYRGYVPVLMVFAAGGALYLLGRVPDMASMLHAVRRWPRAVRIGQGLLLVLLFVPVAYGGYQEYVRQEPEYMEQCYASGTWIAENIEGSPTIMLRKPQTAFYAGVGNSGRTVPDAPIPETIRYARQEEIDLLVLEHSLTRNRRPLLIPLLEGAVPEGLEKVHEEEGQFVIFRVLPETDEKR
jgi:4-amino-4-deoxy-L-arabinose transferase-like glycosyltransferase